jgi:DNA-directed RNA polymerase beta' subunit
MVLGIYYLTMDPTVEVVARRENAERFRSIDNIYDPNIKLGIAFRSNGYYYTQHRDVPGMVLYHDITEEDENGQQKILETAVERTLRALYDGEVDAMLANTVIMNQIIEKRGWQDAFEIANLHERRHVVDHDEVEYLYQMNMVDLHTPILLGNVYDNQLPQDNPEATTVGRAIFNRILPDDLRYVQETLGKKGLQKLVARAYQRVGSERTTEIVDKIKDYGFKYATLSGTTVAVADLTIPEERDTILERADKNVRRAERDFRRGLMTEEERYQITIDEWSGAKAELESRLQTTLDP